MYCQQDINIILKLENLYLGGSDLKNIELKAFKGRNIYSHRKTIKMVVDLGEWIDISSKDIEKF